MLSIEIPSAEGCAEDGKQAGWPVFKCTYFGEKYSLLGCSPLSFQ